MVIHIHTASRTLRLEFSREMPTPPEQLPTPPEPPSDVDLILAIQAETCRVAGITVDELVGPCRAPKVVAARHVAMHLARRHTNEPLSTLAMAFARSPATIRTGIGRGRQLLTIDPDLLADANEVEAAIHA